MFLYIFCSIVCGFTKGVPGQKLMLFGGPVFGKLCYQGQCQLWAEPAVAFVRSPCSAFYSTSGYMWKKAVKMSTY